MILTMKPSLQAAFSCSLSKQLPLGLNVAGTPRSCSGCNLAFHSEEMWPPGSHIVNSSWGQVQLGGEEEARCLHVVGSHQGFKNGKRGSLHLSSFLFLSGSQIQQIIELFTVLSSWSPHHR